MTQAFEAALRKAEHIDPKNAAENCGFGYDGTAQQGVFSVRVLSQPIQLSFPEFAVVGPEADGKFSKTLVTIAMYHLATSDGRALAHSWIPFAKLPGGQYDSAMRSYTSDILIRHFGSKLQELEASAAEIGAKTIPLSGDLSFTFEVFPKVPIALVFWSADDEFLESRASFLFDESAPHHLPTDCYAILCSMIATGLIKKTRLTTLY